MKSLSVSLLHLDQPLQAGADHHTALLHLTLMIYRDHLTLVHLSTLLATRRARKRPHISTRSAIRQFEEKHSRFEQHDVSRGPTSWISAAFSSQVSGCICTEHRWTPWWQARSGKLVLGSCKGSWKVGRERVGGSSQAALDGR